MAQQKALIVGGYGTVGSVVSQILADSECITPVISGRSPARAKELADKLSTQWRTLDVQDEKSISAALDDIDVVVNCFSGPFTGFPLLLPETSARRGIHYLDVSGSFEYAERFLKISDLASQHNATLITALGANPGIPAIVLMKATDDFDTLESGKICFILGAGFEGISVSSLKELKHMLDVKPLIWKTSRWVEPRTSSAQEFVGEPFNRQVYMGISLTRDLLEVPALTGISELSFWSGSQFTGQGLAMILGLKLGLTHNDTTAQLFLRLLKSMGNSKDATSDALIKVLLTGLKQGVRQMMTINLYSAENYATALAPAIVCQQIAEGKITRRGAFVPPQIVPAADFVQRLEKFPIHYSTTVEAIPA